MLHIVKMISATLLPVFVTVVIYTLENRTHWFDGIKRIPWLRQLLIGIIFGGIAVLGTEFGIPITGATLNARDAAPLCAGMIFGAPAGIIAGVIGGVERWFAVLWGAGAYTRLACTLGTTVAGLFGALLRKHLFDDKTPSCVYGLAAGIVAETLHLLLVFLTNMSDIQVAFNVVKICTIPMISMNAISVFLALLLVNIHSDNKLSSIWKKHNITQAFQRSLLLCIIVAFFLTSFFTWAVQSQVKLEESMSLLNLNIADVTSDASTRLHGKALNKSTAESVVAYANNRHVGVNGFVMIADGDGNIADNLKYYGGMNLTDLGFSEELVNKGVWEWERVTIKDTDYYTTSVNLNGYRIIGTISAAEVEFEINLSVYITVFMEILVFAALFILVYFLIKFLIVGNIRKIAGSLAEITDGNLDVVVDVRSNEEFSSLSDDINTTVVTLKGYIDEAAKRIDKELEFAKAIQHSSLPSVFPKREEFELYADMYTAKQVGGDFYDFYFVGGKRLCFLIADVSGKGIPAAMFMMKSKTLIKGLSENHEDAAEIFTLANQQLCENNEANMFVTAWMGILNFETGVLEYVNAGHNPPLLKSGDGKFEYLKSKAGFVLAGISGYKYTRQELTLSAGDKIFLYTDGLTEAVDELEEFFGEERMADTANQYRDHSPEIICRGVKAGIDDFVLAADQFDDMTMLCLEYKGVPMKKSITVDATVESLGVVEDFIGERLENLNASSKAMTQLNIAIDEIFSNIVHYAYAPEKGSATVEFDVKKDDGTYAVITFTDGGKPYNPLEKDDPDTTLSAEERPIGGLGIFMVKKLMDGVDYSYSDNKNVLVITKKID